MEMNLTIQYWIYWFLQKFQYIKTTATESPWSSGLIERHNGVLGNTMKKTMSEKRNYSLETDVAWAIAAKITLKNVYGFSLNQLVSGKKPQLP